LTREKINGYDKYVMAKTKIKINKKILFTVVLLLLISFIIGVLFVKKYYWNTDLSETKTQTITYTGTFPCADCSGLFTTLTLIKKNPQTERGDYILHELYEGKMATPIVTQGTWIITKGTPDNSSAFVLNLMTQSPPSTTYYLMEGVTKLTLLDQNKKKIDSPFNETLTALSKGKQAQLPNPASEKCEQSGGTLTIETRGDGGEYGLCQFEDNRACEEWALYRGECPIGGVKTTGYDTIEQKYCAWVGGQTAAIPNAMCTLPNGNICSDTKLYNGTCQ
jgi:putative hemolysin